MLLAGCRSKEIRVYTDDEINEFDALLAIASKSNAKRYDLRHQDDCWAGRIPGFFCARTTDSQGRETTLDEIVENLKIILGKDRKRLIILMDDDGTDAAYVATKLFREGYYNIHYFKSGYECYANLKGSEFVPETGDCDLCSI